MNGFIGGLITIINYAIGGAASQENQALLTEDNFDILTEIGQVLEVEVVT